MNVQRRGKVSVLWNEQVEPPVEFLDPIVAEVIYYWPLERMNRSATGVIEIQHWLNYSQLKTPDNSPTLFVEKSNKNSILFLISKIEVITT